MTATRFRTIAVTMTLCLVSLAQADVRLPRIFSDHMVLQRDLAVNVWGWAEPGEKVTVLFDGQAVSATADAKGEWRVKLEAMKANATPRDVTVKPIFYSCILQPAAYQWDRKFRHRRGTMKSAPCDTQDAAMLFCAGSEAEPRLQRAAHVPPDPCIHRARQTAFPRLSLPTRADR